MNVILIYQNWCGEISNHAVAHDMPSARRYVARKYRAVRSFSGLRGWVSDRYSFMKLPLVETENKQ